MLIIYIYIGNVLAPAELSGNFAIDFSKARTEFINKDQSGVFGKGVHLGQ